MPSLSGLLHRKSPARQNDMPNSMSKDPENSTGITDNKPSAMVDNKSPPLYMASQDESSPHSSPHFVPGTGPQAHAQIHQVNNIGMAAGAVIGSESGGNPVMGVVDGQVGANMIAQRVQQEQTHQYYRTQAMNYRAGVPADGVGDPGLVPPPSGGRNRSRSRNKSRDERRRKRWDRRAKRRDGEVVEGSSGNDSS